MERNKKKEKRKKKQNGKRKKKKKKESKKQKAKRGEGTYNCQRSVRHCCNQVWRDYDMDSLDASLQHETFNQMDKQQ
jgi:hypothetical protein